MAFDTTMNGALEANDGPLRVRLVSYELTLNKPSTGNEQKTPPSPKCPPQRVDSVPVDSVPVDSVPVDSVPVDSVPVDSVPVDSVPVDSVPVDSVPVDSVPVDSVPVDSVPVDSVPVDSVPVDSVPVDSVPVDVHQPVHHDTNSLTRPTQEGDKQSERERLGSGTWHAALCSGGGGTAVRGEKHMN
ncbi:hypothetical protein NHX12_021667 [Muraenolepis orangiensis]|uniref:Uncharacterized protein n=1 Tax=Muraenolepis orangiensis TaxID=630683 RepID=A0A9Q0ISK2_9TELE|nr:hypothetical protein NHX12_021667 [Muraenolepis orangiensis]